MPKRLFLGAAVPLQFVESISAFRFSNRHLSNIRWTADRNLHITTLFIGETAESEIHELLETTSEALQNQPIVDLQFRSFDIIYRKKRAGMIWLDFVESPEFTSIHQSLHKKIFNKDLHGPVRPHITLARFKYLKEGTKLHQNIHIENKDLQIQEMILYESNLKESGAEYSAIYSWPLVSSGF